MILNAMEWASPSHHKHDLAVSLDAAAFMELGNSTVLNATVRNKGLNNETDVELYLLIDGTVVSNVTVPELLVGESYTTSYSWTPTRTGGYNISTHAPPVAGENYTQNNFIAKQVSVFFYTHSNESRKWVGGGYHMNWHSDDSSWEYALPFSFPFYGMRFDKIYISSNGLITFNAPDSSLGNSIPALARKLAIAPAWTDWVTAEPYDIYVQSNSTCAIIRWDVRHYGSNTEAQFESILWADGTIEFDFRSSNGPFSATVGISNGAGHIIAEDIDNFSGVESRIFLPYRRDVAVYDVQASPAEVYSGQSVSVNVTVGNEGEMPESFDVQVFYENLALNPNVRTSIISSPASPNEPHPGDAIWIEPSFVDLDGLGIGQKFNVTLWTNLTRASYCWQIDIIYNSGRLGATRAEYTAGSSSQFYSGYATVPVSPLFGHVNETHSGVLFGESLVGYSVERPAGFGSLCWIEFQILEKPYPEPADYFELGANDTFACDPNIEVIPVTLFNGAYGSSTQPPPPSPPSNIIGTATVHLDPGTNTTIFLTWNTLGLPLGNYTLRARAMPLAGETDLNNNIFTDGIVEILWRYDVAVIDLTTPVQFIYPGRNFTVDVTVQNNGDAAENVTIVAYFNASSNEILGEGELENLFPGESRTITLTADTKNVTAGHHYVLTAVAIIEEMDYNPSDNRLAGPTITIRFLGDINGDGKVDMKDIGVLARLFGIKAGDTNWNPDCDLNSDGKINLRDVAMAAKNFGKTMD
jgi:archaellum component FlaF (FlaF/FlaG flagellin family)